MSEGINPNPAVANDSTSAAPARRWLPPAWREEELSASDGGALRAPHWMLAGIASFFVIAVLWAWLFRIDEVVRGEARVVTTSQTQYVQNLEGGIVAKILVKEGDLVEKDQVLFQLDEVRFASAFREGRQGELGLRARVARLDAEVQATPLQMPKDIVAGGAALAGNETAVYNARKSELDAKNAVYREQLVQRRQELVELESKRSRLAEQWAILRQEIALTTPMAKEGVVSEVELLRLQRESARIQADLDAAALAMPRSRSAIEEARKKIHDNETQFRSQAASELSVARNELAKVTESVPGLEDRMNRTQVRAPVRGIVKTISSKTPGGVVQPGTSMAEIVAVEDALLVEAQVRPQDIAFVALDQAVTVKLTTYDYSIYGGLDGKIVNLSPDSVQPPPGQSGQAAEPYYVAWVRLARPTISYQGKQLPLIPGMTGQADILTGKRSVLHYLLKPFNKAMERALTER